MRVERKGEMRDLVYRRRLVPLGELGGLEQQERAHALDDEARSIVPGAGIPPLRPFRRLVTDLPLQVDQAMNPRGKEVAGATRTLARRARYAVGPHAPILPPPLPPVHRTMDPGVARAERAKESCSLAGSRRIEFAGKNFVFIKAL